MTNSVKISFIPWNTEHLEMKKFTWNLMTIDESGLGFKFDFENPTYVSMGEGSDKMKITFQNTQFYLIPEDESLSSLPNGYEITIDLPPQELPNLVKAVPKETQEQTLLTLIAANGWLSFLFGMSMQPLFDMINSLQITALLPLTNIVLPSGAMDLFEVILTIVAFDFFPLYNPGFTETEAYNIRFEWFGFDNINFV